MNFLNKKLLRLVLLPQTLYKELGVDLFQLESILRIKLTMDDRRPNTFQLMQRKKVAQPIAAATNGTMLMAALMGLFMLLSFAMGKDRISHLTLYFTFYIVLLSSTLISDFTSVLMDLRDNYVILPKPVNDRTVVVARLLHIIIHLSKLVVPMTLPGFVYLLIYDFIWGAIVFYVIVGLSTLLILFLINAFYLLILKLTTPAAFQSVVSYFQIFISIFVYGGYQLGIRSMDSALVQGYDFSTLKYIWFAPSFWFAKSWNGLTSLRWDTGTLVAMALCFIAPFVSIWMVIKYFAPSFNQRLLQISAGIAGTSPGRTRRDVVGGSRGYAGFLSRIIAKDGPEKMGFLFSWKMTTRSKDFRMNVYPSIGYILVYLVIIFVTSKKMTMHSLLHDTTQGKKAAISVLYFCTLLLSMALNQISYSEKYKAAWIYFTTPVRWPGELITGGFKAVMFKFYFPVFVLVAIPAMYTIGGTVIPNLVLALVNQVLICATIVYASAKYLPFSANQPIVNKSGSFLRTLFTLFFPFVIGFGHYLLADFLWVIFIGTILSAVAAWMVLDSIKKISWAQVKSSYE